MSHIRFISFVFLVFISLSLVVGADIAYITKFSDNPQSNPLLEIEELGHTYTVIDDSEIHTTDFEDYDLIVLEDGSIDDAPVDMYPSLIMNPRYYHEFSSSIASSTSDSAYNLENTITEGLITDFSGYTEHNVQIYYLTQQKYSSAVTVRGDSISDRGKFVVATKEDPRQVFFGITESDYWSETSKRLFTNSITWIIQGDDFDSDSFYTDLDCDNHDPNVYPGAEEIPYNGIDEDCDGFDLTDVDGDSYDSVIVGGSDCNDNDASYNVDSDDKYKNCLNDKPEILNFISSYVVIENDSVEVYIDAFDYESDNLTYSINDSRFVQDGGDETIFLWETDHYDSGSYAFTVRVSDGEFEAVETFYVDVVNLNQAPMCNTIPTITWSEDTTVVLNLSDYCVDLDTDVDTVLEYGIYLTSNEDNIGLVSFDADTGIVEFSSKDNWFGEDWIMFSVNDGLNEFITNRVDLIVTSVNDVPVLARDIPTVTWSEDTTLERAFNLNTFFKDFDFTDQLDFSFFGLDTINISVIIDSAGWVSFSSIKDWFGTSEITFSATDNKSNPVHSNTVYVTVTDANEPPEFKELDCDLEIDEDSVSECELLSEDFENDSIIFTVRNSENMNCEIVNDSTLRYSSEKDFFGNGFCEIEVYDEFAGTVKEMNFTVIGVNDEPKIDEFSPVQTQLKILENTNELFYIGGMDIDSDNLDYFWKINGVEVANESNYTFNEKKGVYSLSAYVKDQEYSDNFTWHVVVGDISEFTCSEVGGDICNVEEEICKTDYLGVNDTVSCCATVCSEKPPEFSEISLCSEDVVENSTKLEIDIRSPKDNDEFTVEENFTAEVIISNLYEKNYEYDLEIYFYDIEEDERIKREKESFDLNKKDEERYKFDFEIDEDAMVGEYAVFVQVESDDGELCQHDYIRLNVEREDEEIRFVKSELSSEDVCAGDYITLESKIKNSGTNDMDDLILHVDNRGLNVDVTSDTFDLEEYDSKRSDVTQRVEFQIPTDVREGEYTLRLIVREEDGKAHAVSYERFDVIDCLRVEEDEESSVFESRSKESDEPIILNSIEEEEDEDQDSDRDQEESIEENDDEGDEEGLSEDENFIEKIFKTLFAFLF